MNEPEGLGARGGALWADVTGQWELDRAELEVLAEACRCVDQLEALLELVAIEGLSVLGAAGQTRVHPAVPQLNATRGLLSKLLSQLSLPDEDEEALPSMASVRARKAAESRWGTHTPRGRRRGA